ncbi:Heavy-metal-associated domain protein [compost metagenome]
MERLSRKEMQMSTTKTQYQIDNMDCSSEEAQIRASLGRLTGVHDLSFDLQQRKLTVEHDPASLPAIDTALREIGMNAKR